MDHQNFGKSWLCLDLCVSVCTGQDFLDFKTNKCECMYCALEDSYNRLQDRLKKVLRNNPIPEGFHLAINCSPLNEGLIEELENKLRENPNIKLIIIDTLQFIRGKQSKSESTYSYDYKELSKLKKFADEHKICILAIHHTKKGKETDPFNMLSGSVGLTGSADTNIVLVRTSEDKSKIQLHITGRDVEMSEKIIAFNNVFFKWEVIADNIDNMTEQFLYNLNPIVITIKALLDKNPTGLKITASDLLKEIYEITGSYPKQKKPNALSAEIKKNLQFQLLQYDGIHYEPPPKNGGSAGRNMYFSKPKQNNK